MMGCIGGTGHESRPVSEGRGLRSRSIDRVLLTLALATTLLTASPSLADTTPPLQPASALKKLSLEQLFQLQVSVVSRKPEPLSRTAAAVQVITQDDLRQMGALSIPEALRDVPGVEVARVDSRQYAITARGFNGTVANKLLVMIDGRSVYTPLYSGVFWDAQDTFLEDIGQIEVIRGPGATVWGSNAVNGVINVLTKDASQTQGVLLTGGGGRAEPGFGGARYGGMLGPRTFFRVYGKHFERDASLRPDGTEAGDDFRMSQGGFRIDNSPEDPNRFTVQGDAYNGSVDQPTTTANILTGGNVLARYRRGLSARSDLVVRAYYDRTHRDAPPVFREQLDTYDLDVRHHFAAGERQDIVWGLEHRLTIDEVHGSASLAFLPEHLQRRLFTAFVQDEITLVDQRLRLTLGSKFEHNDYTGFEYQPSVRLGWTPTSTQTIWMAVSRAVRTPSRIDEDLYVPATAPFLLVGGSGFESEVLRAGELGYKAQPNANLTATIATFYNSYDDLRSIETGPPAYLSNGLTGRTYGVETTLLCQVLPGWRVNLGHAFLRMLLEPELSSTDRTSKHQEGDSPRQQFYVHSAVTLPGAWALDVDVRRVGELPNQQLPAYTNGNARVAWQATHGLELALIGQNLLEPAHAEFGTPARRRDVRRSVFAKVTWRQ